ncbi:MFS transporter [Marinitenerispora sediminis]|uniref:MFS transporter n=1 Tax=Marinitenerispora sediminis TaxID=1931232 RepID=A0A368T3W4_9ACTN|nr:MFS transporter [Marinitenerispora sediminis]RCV55869.1 MFS transporter [Marinitenerispora sediminis]RCV57332.1 MFS transporter [Marinitenerispora sediminis]RCV59420.1 MFS transporter [Marinitenerispora sediminis]
MRRVTPEPRPPSADRPIVGPSHPYGLRGRAFRLLVLATVASFCGYVLLLPVVPMWAARGGAGALGAGATTSVFMLTTVATQVAMPWLLDRGGYRRTFPAGALLLGLPTPLYAVTADLGPLIAVSAVRGVGFGMVSVVGAALAVRMVRPDQVGRASGAYGLAVGLPNLVYLASGVWLALQVGFTAVFWIAAVTPLAGAVVAVVLWRVGGDGMPQEEAPSAGADAEPAPEDRRRILAALVAPLTVMLVLAAASSGVVTFLAIPLEETPRVATAALLGYSVAQLAVRGAAGALADRRGRPVALLPSVVGAVAGLALTAWALWPLDTAGSTGSTGAAGAVAVVVGASLFGAGFGGAQNDTLVAMFRRAGRRGYGTASAAWNIGYDAGTGAGAVVLGLTVQSLGYGPAFAAAAAASAVVLSLPVVRRGARPAPGRPGT